MTFCVKCGKQLQDGEVCSCQAGAAQATAGQTTEQKIENMANEATKAATKAASSVGKVLGDFFKGIFKKPADTVKEYVANSTILSTFIIVGICALISAISYVVYVIGNGLVTTKTQIYTIYGYTTTTTTPNVLLTVLKCVGGFFLGLLTTFGSAALMAVIIMALVRAFEKNNKLAYGKALAIASLSALVTIPCDFVASIIALIPFSFFGVVASWFPSFGSAVSVVLTIVALGSVTEDENHMPIVYGLAAVAAAVLTSLLKLPIGI